MRRQRNDDGQCRLPDRAPQGPHLRHLCSFRVITISLRPRTVRRAPMRSPIRATVSVLDINGFSGRHESTGDRAMSPPLAGCGTLGPTGSFASLRRRPRGRDGEIITVQPQIAAFRRLDRPKRVRKQAVLRLRSLFTRSPAAAQPSRQLKGSSATGSEGRRQRGGSRALLGT